MHVIYRWESKIKRTVTQKNSSAMVVRQHYSMFSIKSVFIQALPSVSYHKHYYEIKVIIVRVTNVAYHNKAWVRFTHRSCRAFSCHSRTVVRKDGVSADNYRRTRRKERY